MLDGTSRRDIGEESKARRWRILLKLVDRSIELGIAAVIIAGIYVLCNLMTGDFIAWPLSSESGEWLSDASRVRMAHNAELAANVILFGSCLTAAAAILRHGWAAAPAYLAAGWGLVLFFLAPWGLAVRLAGGGQPANEITNLLGWTFQIAGQALLLMALLRIVVGVVRRLAVRRPRLRVPVELTLDEDEQEPKRRGRRSLLRKCWELSFCPGEVRDYCPSYLERKSCWRRGRGCLCDAAFWEQATGKAERKEGVQISPAQHKTREYIRQQLELDMSGTARRSRCRACPMYNEHQHYKYRAFYWLAYPVTGVVVWQLMPLIHQGYVWFATILDRLVASAAFLPDRRPEVAPYMGVLFETDATEFMVVLAVAIIVVSYLLELAEFLVFEVKI